MQKTAEPPHVIWIVRHGQSEANEAHAIATAAGKNSTDMAVRDADVQLTELGKRQAAAVGLWFKSKYPDWLPTVVLTSSYVRAKQTADIAMANCGLDAKKITYVIDERLRERESGILDGLTKKGIIEKYPEEFARRTREGKFYHRPPGGESWADVVLRLRSQHETVLQEYAGERVLVSCHSITMQCYRYILEGMTEQQLMALDRLRDVPNCSITSYLLRPSNWKLGLDMQYSVEHLKVAGEKITGCNDSSAIGTEHNLDSESP